MPTSSFPFLTLFVIVVADVPLRSWLWLYFTFTRCLVRYKLGLSRPIPSNEFGTFPIDTTKTRLQIQGQHNDSLHTATRYRGMVDCFLKISREEGIRSLYSG